MISKIQCYKIDIKELSKRDKTRTIGHSKKYIFLEYNMIKDSAPDYFFATAPGSLTSSGYSTEKL